MDLFYFKDIIFSYDNYRFYQTGYDEDTTILSLSHDPYGIAVTYTGYLLLLISIIMFMFSNKSRFRVLLGKFSQRGRTLLLAIIAMNAMQVSASETDRPQVLPQEVA